MDYPKFSDIVRFESIHKKKDIDGILNIYFLLIGYQIKKSKFKDSNYIALQIIINNDQYVIFTDAKLIMNQVKRYKLYLPFIAKIIKNGNNYSLS